MDIKTREIYSEVYGVLNMLGNDYISKLPISLFNMIKEERLDTYNPEYIETLKLSEQNIKRETISMIAIFHLKYWCNTQEEKEELRQLLKDNDNKHQEYLKNVYNIDNIFKDDIKSDNIYSKEKNVNSNMSMVKYEESIFKKLINKIKNIFCKY